MAKKLPLNKILQGNCIEKMNSLPVGSVDLIFADPPYNMQLRDPLLRPNLSKVDAVNDDWDQFKSYETYDQFTQDWLAACKRVLKDTGTLWVIGTYHNIHRVGAALQDMGFWTLNEVTWIKTNPMPNFRGVRFTNAHETLLWVQKKKGAKYTFNYHAMKGMNGDKQMRSDWRLPTCVGPERIKINGKKAHSTQKPESLLYRVINSSSNVGDVILDPFFGSGTTGAVAKKLHRNWIGIEMESKYIKVAQKRIDEIVQTKVDADVLTTPEPRNLPRVPFGRLVEENLLKPGEKLLFNQDKKHPAQVLADGKLKYKGKRGSIHNLAKEIADGPANGWEVWYYFDAQLGSLNKIDLLRNTIRQKEQQVINA
jgi:DNA modification methylase